MLRVNIIGAGKVGRTFMALVDAAPGADLIDILSARPQTAKAAVAAVGAGRDVATLEAMRPADLWFLTVPDDRIAQVAHDLSQAHPAQPRPPVALHCSGFLSSQVLSPLRDQGWSVASCHPVRGFADPVLAAAQFPGTCCAVEGDAHAEAVISDLITELQGVAFQIDAAQKQVYHAAAVFSNNFTTVLQAIAREAWLKAGVSAQMADRLGNSLLAGTNENIARLGPAAALTGPAARGDQGVLDLQEAALHQWHPQAALLYARLSQMARDLKLTGTALPHGEGERPAYPIR